MKTVFGIIMAAGLFLFSSMTENNGCEQLMREAKSKDYDIDLLEDRAFKTKDAFETLSDRGVREAYFFSCDGTVGYLLIKTHDKSVVYKKVPLKTWLAFKESDSREHYYIQHIKYSFKVLR
jgi:hypothetical protein